MGLLIVEKKNKATYKNWCIVINLPKEKSELFFSPKLTTDILKLLVDFYKGCKCYVILHDKDTLEDGTLKTLHIHCVLALENRRSKENVLNDLSTVLKIPLNCVSVDDCKFIQGAVRYLTHYDDTDKYQYSFEDIKTNDRKCNRYFLDIDEYLLKCDSIRQFTEDFGAEKALKYGSLLEKLQKEKGETPADLKRQLMAVQNKCYDYQETNFKLVEELKKCRSDIDTLAGYIFCTLKKSNSIIYDYVSKSTDNLLDWLKHRNSK